MKLEVLRVYTTKKAYLFEVEAETLERCFKIAKEVGDASIDLNEPNSAEYTEYEDFF